MVVFTLRECICWLWGTAVQQCSNVTITDCYFRYTLMCTYIYVSLSLYPHSLLLLSWWFTQAWSSTLSLSYHVFYLHWQYLWGTGHWRAVAMQEQSVLATTNILQTTPHWFTSWTVHSLTIQLTISTLQRNLIALMQIHILSSKKYVKEGRSCMLFLC